MELEIKEFSGEGYAPLIAYNGWLVAVVNACERLLEENICKVERHPESDEVFVLLEGEAVLHVGMERTRVPLETGKFYNVRHGEWHAISLTPGSKVAIVENDGTGVENSEYYYFRDLKEVLK